MMKDLKYALEKGGQPEMAKLENQAPEEVKDTFVETSFEKKEEEKKEEKSDSQGEGATEDKEEKEDKKKKEYTAKDDKEKKDEEKEDSSDDKEDSAEEEKEDEDKKKKFTALQADYEILSQKYSDLEKEIASLREFKQNIEDKEKDALINQFFMLTDDDKKDVI